MIYKVKDNCFRLPQMNHVNPINPVRLPFQFAERIGLI